MNKDCQIVTVSIFHGCIRLQFAVHEVLRSKLISGQREEQSIPMFAMVVFFNLVNV